MRPTSCRKNPSLRTLHLTWIIRAGRCLLCNRFSTTLRPLERRRRKRAANKTVSIFLRPIDTGSRTMSLWNTSRLCKAIIRTSQSHLSLIWFSPTSNGSNLPKSCSLWSKGHWKARKICSWKSMTPFSARVSKIWSMAPMISLYSRKTPCLSHSL